MLKTFHEYRCYAFSIEYDPPGFVVDFPDLPRLITSAPTFPEAFSNACEGLDLYLETLAKFDIPPPEPRHQIVVRTID